MKKQNKTMLLLFLTLLLVLSGITIAHGDQGLPPEPDSLSAPPADTPKDSAPNQPYYKIVIPLNYGKILSVDGDRFISQSPAAEGAKNSVLLYSFDGACLISDMDEIRFADHYIKCRRDGKWGVFSRDGQEILPCIYDAAEVDGNQCMALSQGKHVKPGMWVGDRVIYDLRTKEIVKDIGYGSEIYYEYVDLWKSRLEKFVVDENAAYSRSGQKIVDFSEYKTGETSSAAYIPRGRVFEYSVYNENDSVYYYFSERGRLLLQSKQYFDFIAGEYYINTQDGPYVLTVDQETAIEKHVFDYYETNYECYQWDANDRQLIVGKNGRFGLIEMQPYVSAPSSWAQGYIETAEAYGIVPESLRPLWKENCTRQEFCGILELSVKHMTGKSLADLTEGMELPSFTDCENQAVQRAAALGIVEGVGENKFCPDNLITREQAAVMLSRVCNQFGIDGNGSEKEFADRDLFSPWAADGIHFVSTVIVDQEGSRLMDGVGKDRFQPQGKYTVEQSITTFVRLIDASKL